jgi:hypothetical protein
VAKSVVDPELAEFQGQSGMVSRWLQEMELVETSSDQQQFEKQGERIRKKYRNAPAMAGFNPGTRQDVTFNVLWSNNQVLEPALFSRLPKIYCERLSENNDAVGRYAAKIAERCVSFNQESQYDQRVYAISMCVQDRLNGGRGQGWQVLKSEFEDDVDDEGNPILGKDGEPVKRVKPNSERVEFIHLHPDDYLESKARTQYEVRWRTRIMYYTRQEAVDEFGEEIAKGLNYAANPYKKSNRNQEQEPDFLAQAKVYRICDKTSKKVYIVSPGYQAKPLKKPINALNIKDFWECPIPLCATTTSDSTYPTPDFVIYEALADELDFVCQRLNAMTDCVRLVGAVASQHNKKVKEMLKLSDGGLLPMDNWAAFADKGGLDAMVSWLPYDNAIKAIPVLSERFRELKSMIDEITSMPDIVRGSSDPNDPVYTQQQKSHWTVIKLIKKQQDVQRFCREIARKDGEIIFEFFSDETIWLMAGVQFDTPEEQALFQPALQLLRDDRLRTFRLDIETDSTIAIDEAQAMESWAKYLEGLNFIFSNVESIQSFRPELMTPMLDSAKGAIRSLRVGRSIESSWDAALEQIAANDKAAAENPQPPPPDPAMLKAQTDQFKAQADAEYQRKKCDFEIWKGQQDLMLESQKIEGDLAVKHEKNMIDANEQLTRGQIDKIIADMDIFQAELKNKLEEVRVGLEAERLEWDKKTKLIEVQEKIMEERRLAKDQALENKRMELEHHAKMKASDGDKGESKKAEKPEKSKPMSISINLPNDKAKKPRKRKVTPIRDEGGNIVSAEFEDID